MNARYAFADLRILGTSDVHMHITGWDALRDRMVPGQGMDGLACTIGSARGTAPGLTMLFDNGDALQGTPVGDVCAQLPDGVGHPWPAILNTLRYDAVGLGNHDFDFGMPFLERVISATDAPVLCASIESGHIRGVQAQTLLNRVIRCSDGETRALTVGVTAVLPPQTAIWNHRFLEGRVTFQDGLEATRHSVQTLRDGGADVVVVLCHSGLSDREKGDRENFATVIADKVPDIDVMIMGHTHRAFPTIDHGGGDGCDPDTGTVHGVPAVMPGFGGDQLGIIDLRLAWSEGIWSVDGHSVALHKAPFEEGPDPAITTLAMPAITATRTALGARVADTASGFHSYFEMLQSGETTGILAKAMMRSIRAHVTGTELDSLPLIASVSPMAVGGRGGPGNYVDVPEGVIQERHLAMLCPYPNAIWAAVLNGAELRQWAERAAVYFKPQTSTLSPLVFAAAPSFNFDSLHGLETVIDPFSPPRYDTNGGLVDAQARRVVSLVHEGQMVEDDAQFLVAMTSYRCAGGGLFPGLNGKPPAVRTQIEVKAALREGLMTGAVETSPSASVWRFADGPGTQVTVETSPRAAQHLEDIAPFNPEPIGLSDDGFLRLRVTI